MKYTLFFFALLSYSMVVFAQKAEITGVVIDENSNDKIPFATISVYKSDFSELVKGAVSDDLGKFSVDAMNAGTYRAVVSFIGFKPDTTAVITITSDKNQYALGEIGIVPSAVEIDDVEVRGTMSTTTRKIDRQTYRAADFETAKGGTAVDVLNKLPSVSVGPDGDVSVRGTTEFMVYLNGKPTQMEASVLLNQIAANSIENIEVITVPTARFDAQGKGGIVNITTKKSGSDGLSISASGMAGGAPWGNKTDKYSGYEMNDNRASAGINLVYRKKSTSLYGGFNLNNRNINGLRTGDARLLQTDGSYYHMVASGERPEWFKNISANAGGDFSLSENTTLSAAYFFGNRKEGRSAFYVYNNFFGDIDKNPIPGKDPQNHWIYNPNTDERRGIFHTGNIDLTTKFANNSQLFISALFEHSELSRELHNQDFAFNQPEDNVENLLRQFHETDNTPLNGYRLTVDYDKNFSNGHKLGFGFQPSLVKQTGGFRYDTLNVSTGMWGSNAQYNNDIDLSRSIYAAFADYSAQWGNLAAVAGLRLEYMDQTLELSNPDYLTIFDRPGKPVYDTRQLDFFPTVHLKYALNDNNAFIFAGSRRINRPPTKNMTPFLYRRHYEVYEVGDPELKPEYLTNFELSFDKKIGKQGITLTGFYRGTDNAVFRVNTVYEAEQVLIRSYTNSGNVQALGGELNTNWVAGKFAKFFLGGSLYNFKVQGDVFGYQENNQSTNWSLKGNANLLLTKTLKFTVDFDFKSATVTTQGRNELMFLANSALNYSPAKLNGWDFGVKLLDFLSTNIQALNTRAYDTAGNQIFYQEVEYDRFGPIFEISATYTLNMNGKSAKKADSTFGKEQF
jgi:outer membrane receptor protein involved in Fe transport